MGNALRFLYRCCCEPTTSEEPVVSYSGVSALSRDLYHFETTSQVPDGLSAHVVSSKKAQANWYRKLLEAWRASNPSPRTPAEATRLVTQTLQRHKKADVEGLLTFYGLPLSHTSASHPTLPTGVLYEFHTLPVDGKAIPDGDTMTVYVNTNDPRESSNLPKGVQVAAAHRSRARAERNFQVADELHQSIIDAGYRVLNIQNEEILAKKYRIRLRGIDAPESAMEYGREAKEQLVKLVQGNSIRVLVYGEDRYGRTVADLYCGATFVQEVMLKKGCAWHYTAYDNRPQLAMWEKEARAKRIGLWAARNPMEPWQWRKNKRGGAQ